MRKEDEVQFFLNDFFAKYRVFDILFRDRTDPKNATTLLNLEITPNKRREIIESLTVTDFYRGPLNDTLYGEASMWEFGKIYNRVEVYIKITMGQPGCSVICISFHRAERPIKYPFKQEKK